MTVGTDLGRTYNDVIGSRKVAYGNVSLISGDTSVVITVPRHRKVLKFYVEGMTKYSVSGNSFTATITDPAASVTRNWEFVYQ